MPLIRRYSLISTGIMVCAGSAVLAGSALAQTLIGSAALIQNIVQGHTGGPIFAISRGDGVLLDQFVQTGTESKAKIVFLDTTNMSVGPDSAVKLDQFVYNGNGTAQTVSINATKGAFRFFSGSSAHEAYKVTTPQAVIGVRGTTYDVLIGNGQTYVKLQEGAINACVRVGTECRDLDQPGQYLIVNDSSIEGPFQANNTNFDFGSLCTGGAVALCSKQLAVNPLPPPPPGGGGFQSPAPRNNAAPLPPRPQAPQQPPRVRLTNLPVPGAANPLPAPPRAGPVRRPLVNANPDVNIPPVYIPPHRPPQIRPPQVRPPYVRPPQQRPPVVKVDPPVRVPPVYVPPKRPPHTVPPRPRPYPGRPQQDGRPGTGPNGTPPVILRQGGRYGYPDRWGNGPRWGGPGRYASVPHPGRGPRMDNPRYNQGGGMNRGPRYAPGLRMGGPPRMSGPRMSGGPRMSSGPRMGGGSRGGFGGGRGFGRGIR